MTAPLHPLSRGAGEAPRAELDLGPRSVQSAPAPLRAMVSMPSVACISSGTLLAGGNEVLIEHHGAVYRLKQTALGKLILTK